MRSGLTGLVRHSKRSGPRIGGLFCLTNLLIGATVGAHQYTYNRIGTKPAARPPDNFERCGQKNNLIRVKKEDQTQNEDRCKRTY